MGPPAQSAQNFELLVCKKPEWELRQCAELKPKKLNHAGTHPGLELWPAEVRAVSPGRRIWGLGRCPDLEMRSSMSNGGGGGEKSTLKAL